MKDAIRCMHAGSLQETAVKRHHLMKKQMHVSHELIWAFTGLFSASDHRSQVCFVVAVKNWTQKVEFVHCF